MAMSLDPMSMVSDNINDLMSTYDDFDSPEGSGGKNNQQSSNMLMKGVEFVADNPELLAAL